MTDFAEIAAAVDAQAGGEPADARKALGKYAVRDQVAALAVGGGGGGIPDPITDRLNVATTDANEVPLFIQLPVGFMAGAADWIEVDNENAVRVFSADGDGNVSVEAPTGVTNGTLILRVTGSTARMTLSYGSDSLPTSIALQPGAGQSAIIEIRNADASVEHTLVSGLTPGTGRLGFYGHGSVAQQTGVAVSDAAIHAALVNLGLITA